MNEPSASEALSVETLVAQVADEFLERVQRGERPDIEEYARRYPQVATLLRQMLPTLQLLPDLDPASLSGDTGTTAAASGCLGDYRIVKEVGRGGMGVVYEAEQISLGRRVALKVLPFAAALDVRQLQRFKNEAQAAGQLQHAHIVPVHAVGQERGVHYYAMQFIEGQSLAAFIRELRLGCGLGAERLDEHPTMSLRKFKKASGAAHEVISAKAPTSADGLPASSAAGTVPAAALTTERSIFHAEYFRTAAELGRQAAEALEHAHQMGVIHRDVKPANLLMDLDGKLWVTDFGLAHCQSQAVLTMTGDLLGTLRYMSPEQALARRVGVDHRTDIYSLGVTLYELVTLQPAFSGRDRAALLQQIAFAEPRPPRQLNRTVPAELQTILLKAMEKSPDERYGTAQELADDLGRWLTDEPIRARRPSLWRRLRKWSRRHRAAALGLTAVVLTSLASAGGMAWSFQRERAVRQRETERGVTAALAQAETLLEEGEKQIDFPEHWRTTVRLAQSAVDRAEELLRSGQATSELVKRVHPLRTQVDQVDGDSRLALELDRIRLKQGGVKGNFFDTARAAPLYAKALADYGINPAAPESAAARIGSSRLRPTLLVALENWRRCSPDEAQKRRLEAVLQATEPARGAFRTRWMAAL
ncbi:MAG TPA: serine/threonine-protein kinase, partial [Gemmataceae bacterium]|nr:serine/threonine-protein kinase [Gemmataceae bacterium]